MNQGTIRGDLAGWGFHLLPQRTRTNQNSFTFWTVLHNNGLPDQKVDHTSYSKNYRNHWKRGSDCKHANHGIIRHPHAICINCHDKDR